jgi:hypothetical protein
MALRDKLGVFKMGFEASWDKFINLKNAFLRV